MKQIAKPSLPPNDKGNKGDMLSVLLKKVTKDRFEFQIITSIQGPDRNRPDTGSFLRCFHPSPGFFLQKALHVDEPKKKR